jgi:hypothetical protein
VDRQQVERQGPIEGGPEPDPGRRRSDRGPHRSLVVQRKLTVGAADDPLEVEADRVADQVMRILRSPAASASGPGALGRSTSTRLRRSATTVRRHEHHGHGGPEVGLAGGAISAELSARIERSGGGVPLGARTRARMERGFGVSFADVRVHPRSDLPRQIAADAFTVGSDVHFAPGRYDPSSSAGERLLAHELAHVVQQGAAAFRRTSEGAEASRIARHVCGPGCGHDAASRSVDGSGGLLADELLDVMARPALAMRSTAEDTSRMIRRHASWEHKMLGDVDPATLEVIALGRDVAAELTASRAASRPARTLTTEDGTPIGLDTVLHTIDQEIRRLQHFAANPPQGSVAEATRSLVEWDTNARKDEVPEDAVGRDQRLQEIDDNQWDVRLVQLRLSDGSSFLVTYGELNTLADFYGSAEEIAQTPAANFRGIVAGVREESIRKFMRLRNELTVGGAKPYDPDAEAHDVPGAIGNKGTLNGAGAAGLLLTADQFGELKLMGKLSQRRGLLGKVDESRALIGGREETSYTAGLGRNACHFAPHSWHAWAAAHERAVALALEAWRCNQQVRQLEQSIAALQQYRREGTDRALAWNAQQAQRLRAEADEKLNAALVENAFGDHFLQDSYAAGHLINKTLIMQWFAKWLDANPRKRDYTAADDWRQVQQMAYAQDGLAGRDLYDRDRVGQRRSNDPQSVENIGGDDWTVRFDALGLEIPGVLRDPTTDAFKVFTWWQAQAMNGKLLKADWKDLQRANAPVRGRALQDALMRLIDDGVVHYDNWSASDRRRGAAEIGLENLLYAKSLRIKREYVPKKSNAAAFTRAVQAAGAGQVDEYQKMAKAVSYADYHRFLNHGYLQLASNVLHDHFCKHGLRVATEQGDEPYVIYGDNAMLGRESSKMVKYSAQTSRMSRDSIYELATTGTTAHTTAVIAKRFPAYCRPAGASANISLADWHRPGGSLETFCTTRIFPDEVAPLFSKSTVAASDTLATKISKDATTAIHQGEAF